jgi:hypothetical protein
MPNSAEPSPDLLRRLREFQSQVRARPRPAPSAVVPARGPISGREATILERLRNLSPVLANSFEQALRDLNDFTRLSYVGPAGEVREVLRAAIQMLAPDVEIKKQKWFVGHEQGKQMNPTQAERTRYAVQIRGGSAEQVKVTDALIDELVGQISRSTYAVGSGALHAGTAQEKVRKLTGWIWALLDEVLPE